MEFSGERIDKAKLIAWNQSQAGTSNLELRILQNKLVAYVDGDNNLHGGIQGEEFAKSSGQETVSAPVVKAAPAPTPAPQPVSEPEPKPTPALRLHQLVIRHRS